MHERTIVIALLLAFVVAAPATAGVRRPSDRGLERHAPQHDEEWAQHDEEHDHEWARHDEEHRSEWRDREERREKERRRHDARHEDEWARHEREHHRERDRVGARPGKPHRKWAEVVDVRPVYDRFRVVEPRQVCRTETVTRERGRPRLGGTLIGATVGGALGNGIGHDRRSRRRGTIFGAILGGVLGHEIGDRRARRHDFTQTREVERCRTVDRVSWERRVVAYDVDYRYRGRIYHARMDEHPGRRIRVRVDVQPRGHRF